MSWLTNSTPRCTGRRFSKGLGGAGYLVDTLAKRLPDSILFTLYCGADFRGTCKIRRNRLLARAALKGSAESTTLTEPRPRGSGVFASPSSVRPPRDYTSLAGCELRPP